MEKQLIEVLKNKYEIGNNFASAYLIHALGTDDLDLERFNQESRNPINTAWLDYALSTNMRGKAFAETIRPYIPKDARRYLDVGSAYGGFSIGFMKLGLDTVGLENDGNLVRLSRANFRDHGKGEESIIHGDILDDNLLPELGRFDVITCIDVIEHVDDVPKALRNMVYLLNPGGILLINTPNKDSLSNIIADSHFGIFGLTLLKRPRAQQFYFYHFPERKIYHMGEYYGQSYYLKMLAGMGCQSTVLPPLIPATLGEKIRLLPKYFSCLGRFLFKGSRMPVGLRLEVAALAVLRMAEFFAALFVNKVLKRAKHYIQQRFVDDAWLLLATKSR